MNSNLFNDFNDISAKEWKQKIQADLKGADYNETLVYQTIEGIDIKPFYNQEDISEIDNPVTHPTTWKNAVRVVVSDAAKGSIQLNKAIEKGAESLYIVIENEQVLPAELIKNISKVTPLYIETRFLSSEYNKALNEFAIQSELTIYLLLDIISNLAATGNWFHNLKNDHAFLEETIKSNTNLKSICSIDISLYQNAGASIIQQLAYALAQANEYLNHFNEADHNPFTNNPIVFKVAVGGNYFFEIAKIRAIRLLWEVLAKKYSVLESCKILAYPSYRNKTILDYNVNMLRTTTECMSAILGGADTICNIPYDDIYNLENDFGARISLNQLLILKNESYFDKVTNPASGSYYIETITHQLAEQSLALFKNIEKGGGFLSQIKEGIIQKKIKETARKEQELFDEEKIILTGTNKYKNQKETLVSFQKEVFTSKNVRKTLISPIITSRLSEKIEKKLKNS